MGLLTGRVLAENPKRQRQRRCLLETANTCTQKLRTRRGGAGGNRTPVRQSVTDRATTIPEIAAHGCRTAGSGGPQGPDRRVFPPGQRSFTPSAVCPCCLHRFCCQAAADRPRVPLPVAMTLYRLTRSGGESEIVRIGVSLGAPFKESEQLRSHEPATVTGVETDQPRGLWARGAHRVLTNARFSKRSRLHRDQDFRVPPGTDS